MPIVVDGLNLGDGDGFGPNQRVYAFAKAMLRDRLRYVHMSSHRESVNTGIRPPGGMHGGQFAGHAMDGLLEPLLDGGAVVLPLPAHEGPPVELDREAPAGHGRVVPFGMAKPRSSSSTVIALRPARCTLSGLT